MVFRNSFLTLVLLRWCFCVAVGPVERPPSGILADLSRGEARALGSDRLLRHPCSSWRAQPVGEAQAPRARCRERCRYDTAKQK